MYGYMVHTMYPCIGVNYMADMFISGIIVTRKNNHPDVINTFGKFNQVDAYRLLDLDIPRITYIHRVNIQLSGNFKYYEDYYTDPTSKGKKVHINCLRYSAIFYDNNFIIDNQLVTVNNKFTTIITSIREELIHTKNKWISEYVRDFITRHLK